MCSIQVCHVDNSWSINDLACSGTLAVLATRTTLPPSQSAWMCVIPWEAGSRDSRKWNPRLWWMMTMMMRFCWETTPALEMIVRCLPGLTGHTAQSRVDEDGWQWRGLSCLRPGTMDVNVPGRWPRKGDAKWTALLDPGHTGMIKTNIVHRAWYLEELTQRLHKTWWSDKGPRTRGQSDNQGLKTNDRGHYDKPKTKDFTMTNWQTIWQRTKFDN